MGTITTGVGLISGIDTATLIEQLLALESRGKITLQQRAAGLKAQQTALLDINARLLNLQTAVKKFRQSDIFQSAQARSSHESIMTAVASAGAVPGSYNFFVDRLVQTSQQMSRGFADLNTTGIGLTEMSFEFGRGKLTRDQELSELNGGGGVRRGKIVIRDASGAQATIDLSKTVSIQEVLDQINAAADIGVSATVSGDSIQLTDTSGGAGVMSVANASGYFTATDLGLLGDDGGTGTLTGSAINTIGAQTALTSLNDGNGVLINSGLGNVDFRITDRTGAVHDIVLGKYDNNGTIESAVTTLADVIDRIETMTGGAVTAAIAADGVSLELTDHTAGGGNFSVTGAGTNGDHTATDLGILNAGVAANTISGSRVIAGLNSVMLRSLDGGSGIMAFGPGGNATLTADTLIADLFNGSGLTTNGTSATDIELQDRTGTTYEIDLDALTTVGDLIDAVNDATDGEITFAIEGQALKATNHTAGLFNFSIQDINASGAVAELGLTIDSAPGGAEDITGSDTLPAGTDGTTLDITNRNGVLTSIDLSSAVSFSDVINLINASGAGVVASLNKAGNGLLIADETGGASNLIIGGSASSALRISTGAAGVASDTVRGYNLQLQYVSEATRLDDLNYGRGIGKGTFRIVDADGDFAEVEIGSDAVTLQDVIAEINSKGLDILARVNDQGDGLVIESTSATGSLAIRVENVSGGTAEDLGILGAASDPVNANFIDGSYERTVTFEATDTLDEIASKINSAGIPVSASIINTGAGANPFRLVLASEITGGIGDMSVDADGFDLGLTVLNKGADAKIFFGSSNPAEAVYISSDTNTLDGVIKDVDIDLVGSGDSLVTINVTRDTEAIVEAVKNFVTTFNDVIGRINDYDSYDSESEERGVLLGDPTVASVRSAMYRTLRSRAIGVDDQFTLLTQVGIRVGTNDGELTFDEDKFRTAMERDFDAVADLFAAFDKDQGEPEEIAPGVTTGNTTETVNKLGIMEIFAELTESMLNSVDGTLTRADDSFESRIGLIEDRIERFDERLEARRLQLQTQFAAMESALARLQGQQSALVSLQNAVLAASVSGLGLR